MTANDDTPGTGHESTGSPANHEEFAADTLSTLVSMHRRQAEDAFREVENELRDGERPTEDQLDELRQSAEGLRWVTDEYVSEFAAENSS